MNVFKKLKGTFQNAQQDVVDGLRALTSLDAPPRHELLKDLRSRQINLDAGADLLHSYQKAWSEMQVSTKESANKAEEIRMLMIPMFKVWDGHAEVVTKLDEEVRMIPNIIASLKQSQDLLNSLRKDFGVAEKAMDMLENICEELDQQKQRKKELQNLAKYKKKSASDAQKVKIDLANSHAKRITDIEAHKRERLQDRVEAFSSAFEEDVDYYKEHGHTDRFSTKFPHVTSLSDIQIEADGSALDSFLGNDGEISTDDNTHSEEDTYMEDDYTDDFSIKQDEEDIDDRENIESVPVLEQLRLTQIEDDEFDDGDDSHADSPVPPSDKSPETDQPVEEENLPSTDSGSKDIGPTTSPS